MTAEQNSKYGVLLVNLGSPAAPTKKAVKEFLLPFLSDKRVVDKPSWFWQPLLRGVIIPARVGKVSKAYQSIWTEQGSPLIAISKQQQAALQNLFAQQGNNNLVVELAMTYNKPSITDALSAFKQQGIDKIVVLPLYPQYSSTTTAAVFDAIANACKKIKQLPEFRFINHYYSQPSYIDALASSINKALPSEGEQPLLIFSFHGLPQRYVDEGDPYQQHCQQTADLVAKQLKLEAGQWQVAYQSRVGVEPWLQPYLDEQLEQLPSQGRKNVILVCPAFSADCLETLEEINIENKKLFLESGGESYQYIPALNDDEFKVKL